MGLAMTDRSEAVSGNGGEFVPHVGRKKYRLRRRLFSNLVPSGHSHSECCNHEHDHGDCCGHATAEQPSTEALEALQKQLQEANEIALRARADLENQRKRHMREKEEIRKFANETLVSELVPALDHFALALKSFETASDVNAMREGVTMIHREIMGVLQGNGLVEIDRKSTRLNSSHVKISYA